MSGGSARPPPDRLPQPRRRGAGQRLRVAARAAARSEPRGGDLRAARSPAATSARPPAATTRPTSLSPVPARLRPRPGRRRGDSRARPTPRRAGHPRPQGLRPGLRQRPLPHRRRPPPGAAPGSPRVRTGDERTVARCYQHALRDVIGRCLYGVDINPMAVELCKVSLWLEALEPGKPLSFLDHHIRVGNSLLGATPELTAARASPTRPSRPSRATTRRPARR